MLQRTVRSLLTLGLVAAQLAEKYLCFLQGRMQFLEGVFGCVRLLKVDLDFDIHVGLLFRLVRRGIDAVVDHPIHESVLV